MNDSLKAELQKMLDEAVSKTGIGNGSEQVTPPKAGPEKKQPESGGADYGDMVGFSKSIEALQKAVETLTEALSKGKMPPWMKDDKDDGDDDDTDTKKSAAEETDFVSKATEMFDTVAALRTAVEGVIGRVENIEKHATVRKSLSGQDGSGAGGSSTGFDSVIGTLARGGKVRLN